MIYLDNAATTPIAPEPAAALQKVLLSGEYGNAGGLYKNGRRSAEIIAESRRKCAALVGGKPDGILFTSGGSEGNSLVFAGLAEHLKKQGKTHIVTSLIEHASVIHAAEYLQRQGFTVDYVRPNSDGIIPAERVKSALKPNTGLVSIMYVNNELGTVQPISEIGGLCYKAGVLFHSDCVQAAGYDYINAEEFHIDFLTVSGHKIHAPMGTGFLYAKDKYLLQPIIYGGQQEFGLRGGTENVAGIAALGEASAASLRKMMTVRTHIFSLNTALSSALKRERGLASIIHINCPGKGPEQNNRKIVSLQIDGVDADSLILMLDTKQVCVAAGSACSSRGKTANRVLRAVGLSSTKARETIRISFSQYTTREDVQKFVSALGECVRILLRWENKEIT